MFFGLSFIWYGDMSLKLKKGSLENNQNVITYYIVNSGLENGVTLAEREILVVQKRRTLLALASKMLAFITATSVTILPTKSRIWRDIEKQSMSVFQVLQGKIKKTRDRN